MAEIYGLVDRLTLRVEALENAQPQPQTKEPGAEPDDDSPGHVSEVTESEGQQEEPGDAPDPEAGAGRTAVWLAGTLGAVIGQSAVAGKPPTGWQGVGRSVGPT